MKSPSPGKRYGVRVTVGANERITYGSNPRVAMARAGEYVNSVWDGRSAVAVAFEIVERPGQRSTNGPPSLAAVAAAGRGRYAQ
jgi:hypothetical protein